MKKGFVYGLITLILIGNIALSATLSVNSYAVTLEEDPVEYAFSWLEDQANALIERAEKFVNDIVESLNGAAESIGNNIGEAADGACSIISDATGAACQKIIEAAGVATQAISETAGQAAKEISESVGQAAKTIGDATDEAGKVIGEAAEEAGATIGRATNAAGETIGQAAYDATRMYDETKGNVIEKINEASENIEIPEIEIPNIEDKAIDFENIGNLFGFDDVNLYYLKEAGDFASKFFDAKNEDIVMPLAENLVSEYSKAYTEAETKGEEVVSMAEFLDDKLLDPEYTELFKSLTNNSKRVITEWDFPKVQEYLRLRVSGEDTTEIEKKLTDGAKEILDYLFARSTRTDGKVIELRNDGAMAMAELITYGDLPKEELKDIFEVLGIKPSQIVLPEYVLKRAVGSGVVKDKLKTVLEMAPGLMDSLDMELNKDNIDLSDFDIEKSIDEKRENLEKSFSKKIGEVLQSDELKEKFPDIDSKTMEALAKIAIEAGENGYKLSRGEISSDDFGKKMSVAVFETAMSFETDEKIKSFLQLVPYAYMSGSLAGSLFGDEAYRNGEEILIGMLDAGGFEAIVPNAVITEEEIGQGLLKKADIKAIAEKLTDAVYSISNGKIKIQNMIGGTEG